MGKVYLRRSLETGIKDEGIKNLKRADVCFTAALELFLIYNKPQTEQVIELMAQSMDFRVGDQRTLWNEAIIIEAREYDDDNDSDDSDNSDDEFEMSFGSQSFDEGCMDNPLTFCGWKLCLFNADNGPVSVDNLTLLREQIIIPRSRLR